MFSRRLDWEKQENALARLEAARRAAGARLLDLTGSNPTNVGLRYPAAEIAAALADGASAPHEPSPRGLPSARAAIAADYRKRRATIDPDLVFLSASSSESYAWLFKLVCDPGDEVLVPEPSYPLFEYLARLEGVAPVAYRLDADRGWRVNLASVESASAGGRARALVVVSPNNPTGSLLREADRRALDELCAERGLALIADEVFADYAPGAPQDAVDTVAGLPAQALTFALGGLSKSCGLPQLKLGWTAVGGPAALAASAAERLEQIADAFLSAATPVQVGLPRILELGAGIRAQITARVAENRAALERAAGTSSALTLLPSEGGWSAIVRAPEGRSDEDWALALLGEDDVLVHPGYFFDMPPGPYLVLGLLPEPDVFAEGVARLTRRFAP